ncbi:MAG: transcriptional regulator, TetR family [Bacteroidetes bacterium]|jgi:AcrR family transcriptional regulator|nr:transcriptional regulator, TetR family [Bacteroidota bacterium]
MDINPEQNMEKSILKAAEIMFLEKGFEATSTTQIAKAVGCNQALVHYYFRTKDNLFNTIFESKFKSFFKNIFDTTQLVNLSFLDKIKHIADTHFDLLYENPQIPKLILNELARKPEHLKVLRDKLYVLPEQLFSMMSAELEKEIEAGRVKNVTFVDIIITIVSLNVAMFVMEPVVRGVLQLTEEQKKFLLLHRKKENLNVILSYLKPE